MQVFMMAIMSKPVNLQVKLKAIFYDIFTMPTLDSEINYTLYEKLDLPLYYRPDAILHRFYHELRRGNIGDIDNENSKRNHL